MYVMNDCAVCIALLKHVPALSRRKIIAIIDSYIATQRCSEQAWSEIDQFAGSVLNCDEIDKLRQVQHRWSLASFTEYLQQKNIGLVSYLDATYPLQLKEQPDFPLVLFTQGEMALLQKPMVAVVGSRKPTRYGQLATEKVVSDLVGHQVVIVSGFMVGIDYNAHHLAMLYGGSSVGVLGFGFDHFYPQHLRSAAVDFVKQGNLLISEYPPSYSPNKGQFPARNRIVASLCLATVVIEAQKKSGSLITAQFALDYNKLVAAVPGPIDSIYSEGTNHLIQEGALLLTSGEEIWAEISINAVR